MPRIMISVNAPDEVVEQDLVSIEIPPGITIHDLKGFVQAETNFPINAQQFWLNGQPLIGDNKTLEEAGVNDGEMLAMIVRRQAAPAQSQPRPQTARQQGPNNNNIESTRQRILNNPEARSQIGRQNPEIAAALDDPVRFRQVWLEEQRREAEVLRERNRLIQSLNEDPFNVEKQQKIEEILRQENVQANCHKALEEHPEGFASITMLYINVEVNGFPVKAFVDSGAQTTVMSPSCAEACSIMRLLDKRYSGTAVGVGTAKILGRVHLAEMRIGDAIMPSSFTVMEGKDVDLLLGLDMLKRFQACIDLRQNKLILQGTEVPFLPESELPKREVEAQANEPTIPGPVGTEIGTKSGTVKPAGSSNAAGASSSNFQGAGRTLESEPATSPQPPQTSESSQSTPQAERVNTPGSTTPTFPQASIDQLQSLGFSRDEAIRALNATDGNVDYAASFLFE